MRVKIDIPFPENHRSSFYLVGDRHCLTVDGWRYCDRVEVKCQQIPFEHRCPEFPVRVVATVHPSDCAEAEVSQIGDIVHEALVKGHAISDGVARSDVELRREAEHRPGRVLVTIAGGMLGDSVQEVGT